MNPTNEITFNGLGNPEQPIQTPPAQTSVEPLATFTAPTAQETQALNTAQTNANTSEQDYMDALFGGSTIESSTLKAEEKAGLPQLQTELTDITNQIMKTDLDFRREREMLQTEPGLTTAQRQARLADVTRKQSSQRADLEVIRSARSNTLTNAQSIIQKKVNAEFAEQEKNLNGLKFLAERADGKLKTQLDAVAKKEERAFNVAKSEFEKVESEKLQLVRNAQANGADNGTMSAILGSKTLQDAYKNAGRFGVSIDDKIKRANYSQLLKELGGETTVSEEDLTGVPSQDIAAIIKATGAKPNAKMSDAIGVIKGLEDLAFRNTEGQFKGMAPGIRFPFLRGKTARTERQFNLGDINAINLKVQQWASGASLTKQQEKAVKDMVPDKNDSDEQAKRKINQLTDYMLGQVSSELSSQGIQSTKPTFSFFDSGMSDFQIDENGNILIPGDLSNEDFFNQF